MPIPAKTARAFQVMGLWAGADFGVALGCGAAQRRRDGGRRLGTRRAEVRATACMARQLTAPNRSADGFRTAGGLGVRCASPEPDRRPRVLLLWLSTDRGTHTVQSAESGRGRGGVEEVNVFGSMPTNQMIHSAYNALLLQ